MSQPVWETVEAPVGNFVGWGTQLGQYVEGEVLDYSRTAGTDFDGDPCPLLSLRLTKPAASFSKDGTRRDFDVDEIVNITCGQANLKAGVQAMNATPGDLIHIELESIMRVNKGDMKKFIFRISRAAGTPKIQEVTPSQLSTPTIPAANPFTKSGF